MNHIEKAAHRPGEYVAYVNGAQRIHRTPEGWKTYALGSSAGTFTPIAARTLREMDAKIAQELTARETSIPLLKPRS